MVKDRIALLERRNELRARMIGLAKIRRDMEQDKLALHAEITVTNNRLRDVEIDLEDLRNEKN